MQDNCVGAQLFTCREFTKTIEGVRETFEKVSKIGYTAVQVSGFGPVDPKEVARLADDNGLNICATHVGWNRFKEDLDGLIEEHKTYKCNHPAIGAMPGDYRSLDGVKKFVDELGPIAEKLSQAGMDFSYHNHDFEFFKVGDKTLLEMLYDLGSPEILKAELDVFWVQAGGGSPEAWVRKCAGRQPLVHFKDMVMTEDRERRFAPIGEGNLNWPGIIQACEESGVDWVLVEQDQCYGEDPFDCLATSYRNLKAMGLS